jgi:hypothetical protein
MRLVSRMVLVAIIVGTATSVAATGRITVLLLLSGAVCWSVVPLVQLCTGVMLVRGSGLSTGWALERYFQTHAPWSLWLLGVAGMLVLLPNPVMWIVPLATTFVFPLALTVRKLYALCRGELGFSAAVAWRRTLFHQAVTVLCLVAYGEYAGRFFPRLIDTVAP